MGFNISQIINKFVPTKRVDDDLRENPYGTALGQEIVSVNETFWARIAREGKLVNKYTNNRSLPTGGVFTAEYFNPDPDMLFYPRFISLSATVDCELVIQVNTMIPQQQSMYAFRGFAKAGTPILVTCDGDTVIDSKGTIGIGGINNGASAGLIIGSIYGYEVGVNV